MPIALVPFDWSLPGWLAGSCLLRMFGVTAGYHRYFSHRSYKLGRARWLDRYHSVPPAAFAGGVFAVGGLSAFVWGYLLATVILYHATFAINSVAHVWGTRRFATGDDSRNNWWLAIATLGEGWQNSHHYCMSSSRQGIRWWEFDAAYAGLRALEAVGIAHDLRPFVEREGRRAA